MGGKRRNPPGNGYMLSVRKEAGERWRLFLLPGRENLLRYVNRRPKCFKGGTSGCGGQGRGFKKSSVWDYVETRKRERKKRCCFKGVEGPAGESRSAGVLNAGG